MTGNVHQLGSAQQQELNAAISKALIKVMQGMTADIAQGWIGNAPALQKVLLEALLPETGKKSSKKMLKPFRIVRERDGHVMGDVIGQDYESVALDLGIRITHQHYASHPYVRGRAKGDTAYRIEPLSEVSIRDL